MSVYVVGHKNPDTDSVISAIVFSNLEPKNNKDYVAAILGEPNKETLYVLNRFNFEVPEQLPEGEKKLLLVDHNNPAEGPDDLMPDEIIGIFDHHKLVAPVTNEPVLVRILPVGSTCTLARKVFTEKGVTISKDLAGAMISAIISDTLNLTSPTTTEEDRVAVTELNKIADLDVNELANEMFKAKSDISDISTEDLICKDYKVFTMGNKKVGLGVWETVMPELILERKEEIIERLKARKNEDKLDLIFFFAIDILNTRSDLFIAGTEEEEIAQNVYGKKATANMIELPGIVSRKKQMTPLIEKYILTRTA